MKRGVKLKLSVLAVLVAAAVLSWTAVFQAEAQRGRLRMTVFDVGQGDGIFIVSPGGAQMLIDGGPDQGILADLGRVMPFWDRSIDILVLSHPHADHVTGALDVIKNYDVGVIIESGVNYSTPEYAEWQKVIDEKHIPVHIAEAGESVDFGDGAHFDILLPERSFADASLSNVHDSMVVGRLVYASNSAMLMGDAEAPLEQELIQSGQNIKADILKIGHHGSKTSTSDAFLQAVHPLYAIISVGRKNMYGHPHQSVLDRLEAFGIKIFRTDTDGDVSLASDGHGWAKE